MNGSVAVENIKCGGCARSIARGLESVAGITGVDVDVARGEVSFIGDEALRPAVVNRLREMGYPERGTATGLDSAVATARSFVSCAVGKMSGMA